MDSSPTQTATVADPARVLRGVAWAVVSMALFTLTPVFVRFLSSEMHAVEIIFHRSLIATAVLLAWFHWRGIARLRTRVFRSHVGRAALNFAGMALWFQAIIAMPLAEATALHFTLPLYTVIFAALFLGERVGWRRWSATAVGFLGALIVLRPGAVPVSSEAMMVLASAAFYGGAVVMIKLLTRTDAALPIAFYSNLLMGAIALVPTIFLWQGPALADIPMLLALAFIGTAAPYCFTRALANLDASVVAPLDFLRLPFTAFAAWLIFTEVPDRWTWVGAAVIFGSTTYVARREARLKEREGAASAR
ncbi:MAG: DMT family transporter [Defluviicoccus sp.]|nr:DMT family transporter [Defluviicoccus sp.]MDE0385853.1 DMT family transporter [Defluviicoccus sp.]